MLANDEQRRAESNADGTQRIRRILEGVIGVPATEGNRVDVLRNGDQIFPAMLESIEGAANTVDLLTFVYWEGKIGREFAHALAARARDGVRVRVLLDAWGARPIERTLLGTMEKRACGFGGSGRCTGRVRGR